jgi:hypothetical protein
MQIILTFTLAVAIALAPASASAQGRIIGQQSYVTGSKPDPGREKGLKTKKAKAAHHKRKPSYKVAKTPPGKYRLVEIKKAKAVHPKRSNKVARAPHYAKHSYFHASRQHHRHDTHPWFLPALVGAAIGLGLFHFWH